MVNSKSQLLTFIRKSNEEEIINQLRGLSEDQWETLLTTARRHRLSPILFYSLKPYYSSTHIPVYYQDRMRKIYFNSASRNMRLYHELEELVGRLSQENIPVILLKGAHLAKYIYGNIALRPMGDIDLMVKQGDLEQVHRLLIEDGYSTTGNITEEELPAYVKKGEIPLEIHSNFKKLPFKEQVDFTAIWTRAEKVNLGDTEVLILSPEDLVLHLCLHNCIHHCFDNGFISCFDIAHAAKFYKGKLDWNKLWARAEEWGIERAVYLMLALTEKMIGLSIPKQIKHDMEVDRKALRALAEAEELLFEQSSDLSPNLAFLFGNQAWRKKYDIILQRIFISEVIDKIEKKEETQNNIFRVCLYFSSRLWILLKRYRKTVWLALCRNPHTLNTINNKNRREGLRAWLKHTEK